MPASDQELDNLFRSAPAPKPSAGDDEIDAALGLAPSATGPEDFRMPPSPATLSGWEALTPRSRAFAMQQHRQRIQAERTLTRLRMEEGQKPAQLPIENPRGFWKALDYLDRPRNAVDAVFLAALKGEGQPQDLINHFWSGLTARERNHASDMLDALSPEVQRALYFPFDQARFSRRFSRGLMGFAGDILTDPGTWIPMGKVAKALGEGAEFLRGTELGKAIGAAHDLPPEIRQNLKNLSHLLVSRDRYEASGLEQQMIDLHKMIKPLRKHHEGLISRLAEERDPKDVVNMVSILRKEVADDPARLQAIFDDLAQGHRFVNPDAIKELAQIRDQNLFDTAISGMYKQKNIVSRAIALQESEGRVVPELGRQLVREADKLEAVFNRTLRETIKKETEKRLVKIEQAKKLAQVKGTVVRRMLGQKKLKEMGEFLRTVAPGDIPATRKSPEILNKALRGYMTHMTPGFIGMLRTFEKDQKAIQLMLDNLQTGVFHSVTRNPKINRMIEEMARQRDAIARLPAWVPHVGSADFVARLAKLPAYRREFGGRFLRVPRNASDIIRRFVDKEGVSLSLDQVEDIHRAMDFTGDLGGLRKGGPVLDNSARGRFLALLKKEPRKVARIFDTDERVMNEAMKMRTARSVATAEYLNEASRIFGLVPEQNLEGLLKRSGEGLPKGLEVLRRIRRTSMTPEELRAQGWLTISNDAILHTMPHLRGVYFDPDVLHAVVKQHENFVNPDKVLRFYDSMRNWWISYQLPLFTAFHTRNVIGNVFNMTAGGFLDDPKDIGDFIKASSAQMFSSWKNPDKLRWVKFHMGATDEVLDADRAIQLALKHNVIGTGWFSLEAAGNLDDAVDGVWRWKSIIPGTSFLPVRAGKAVGKALEENARFTFFVNRLRKGDAPAEAAIKVKKFLGGFGPEDLSSFERQVMKRVFPFYSWSRYNVPLQFEQLLFNNRYRTKILSLLRGQQLFQKDKTGLDVADLPQEEIPGWMQEMVPFPLRRNKDPQSERQGEIQLFFLENWLPAADVDNFLAAHSFFRYGLSQLTPFLQLPLQEGAGRILYTDRPLKQRTQEFLGKELPASAVTALRTFRLLSWMDQNDFLGDYHYIRRFGQPTTKEKLARNVGFTTFWVNPAKARSQFDTERLEILRDRINNIRSRQQSAAEKANKEEQP